MVALVLPFGSSGCAGCDEEVCAAPSDVASPPMGDANGDGVVDISDGVWIQRHAYAGGPAPACAAAADLLGYGDVETASSVNLWYYLFTGTVEELPELPSDACAARDDVGAPPPCAVVELAVGGPNRAEGGPGSEVSFEVVVTLHSEGLDGGPDAWSFGVGADGCEVAAATTRDTAAADAFDSPPGIRSVGFERSEIVDGGGAVSAVVASWLEPVKLEGQEEPRPVLRLTVRGTAPDRGCDGCRVFFDGDQVGSGQPVANVVSVDGWSYLPTLAETTIKVCSN